MATNMSKGIGAGFPSDSSVTSIQTGNTSRPIMQKNPPLQKVNLSGGKQPSSQKDFDPKSNLSILR